MVIRWCIVCVCAWLATFVGFVCIPPSLSVIQTVDGARVYTGRVNKGSFGPTRAGASTTTSQALVSNSTHTSIPQKNTKTGQGIKKHYEVRRGGKDKWDGYVDIRVALNEQKVRC